GDVDATHVLVHGQARHFRPHVQADVATIGAAVELRAKRAEATHAVGQGNLRGKLREVRTAHLDLAHFEGAFRAQRLEQVHRQFDGLAVDLRLGGRRLVAVQVDAVEVQREIHAAVAGVVIEAPGELRVIESEGEVRQPGDTALPGI